MGIRNRKDHTEWHTSSSTSLKRMAAVEYGFSMEVWLWARMILISGWGLPSPEEPEEPHPVRLVSSTRDRQKQQNFFMMIYLSFL